MKAMIQNDADKSWMLPLLELRNELDFRGDAARRLDLERREVRRLRGAPEVNRTGDELVPGPYTQEARARWLRRLLEAPRGLEEAPSRVGPTAEPLDADMGAHVGWITFVAVPIGARRDNCRAIAQPSSCRRDNRHSKIASPPGRASAHNQPCVVFPSRRSGSLHRIESHRLHVAALQQVLFHPLDQRFKQRGGGPHPIAQVLARDRRAPSARASFPDDRVAGGRNTLPSAPRRSARPRRSRP